MNEEFIIIKNFLTKSQCNNLINYYNKNIHNSFEDRNKFPLDTDNFPNITEKIKSICLSKDPSCKLDTHQIVRWPKGSKMGKHLDPKDDVFACIVYLNDNYSGGETCFYRENFFEQDIKPEVGKLIIFSNSKILHWVNEVKYAERYTLALWFVSK